MSGLLSYISPLLTVASEASAAQQEGKEQGNKLLRAIYAQNVANEEKRSQTEKNRADALLSGAKQTVAGDPTKVITAPGQPVNVVHTATGNATQVNGQDGKPITTPARPAPRIDPLSPQGIAARKQIQPPTKPAKIDPLSAEGIAAQRQLKGDPAAKALAGPISAKVGQAGEMLKKAADLLPAMEALDVTVDKSAGQDIAAHGIGVGHARIPGTAGVGSLMVNRSPEFATYQASLTPFVLAAAHALSGARINQDQVEQIRQSVEIKPGDTPKVRAQKKKNVVDLINSINGSLPPDAIAAQESQMDPGVLETTRKHGYKSAAPSVQPPQGHTPTGDVKLGVPLAPSRAQQLWDAAVAKHGKAKVEAEVGPRPQE